MDGPIHSNPIKVQLYSVSYYPTFMYDTNPFDDRFKFPLFLSFLQMFTTLGTTKDKELWQGGLDLYCILKPIPRKLHVRLLLKFHLLYRFFIFWVSLSTLILLCMDGCPRTKIQQTKIAVTKK